MGWISKTKATVFILWNEGLASFKHQNALYDRKINVCTLKRIIM